MSAIQRNLFGIFGLISVVIGILGVWSGSNSLVSAACLRTGLVILAVWLAIPELAAKKASSAITVAVIVALIALFSTQPKLLFWAIALLMVGAVLQTVGRRLIKAISKPND